MIVDPSRQTESRRRSRPQAQPAAGGFIYRPNILHYAYDHRSSIIKIHDPTIIPIRYRHRARR
jgi:hypothetical protein